MEPLNIVRPTFPPLAALSGSVASILTSGNVTNNGRYVQKFEEALTNYLGVPTICFSSGQAALMAMLWTHRAGEIVTPSFTFVATAAAIRATGSTPVFSDIHADTLGMNLVGGSDTCRMRAVLAVDPYGICCNYDAIAQFAKWTDVKFFVDSAAAFGSEINWQLTGGFADAQIFSFHATKPFSTMEGGCLCSHDEDLLARAKQIRNFGQASDSEVECVGFNGKMQEICAIIGLEQLKTWPETARRRKENATLLRHALSSIERKTCVHAPSGQSPIWLYQPILLDPDVDRDEFVQKMHGFGVHVRKYYSPGCHQMAPYLNPQVKLPATEDIAARVVSLPVYNDMTPGEIDRIASAVEGSLK